MAIQQNEIKDSYPLPVYNYVVHIGSENYGFSQVSGLSVQYDSIAYRHGLSWLEGEEFVAGLPGEITVTLQKGVMSKGSVLLEWITGTRTKGFRKQDVVIDLCDESGVPLISWSLIDAFPTRLEGPSFDANSNEVAIESMELKAGTLKITYHQTGQFGIL